MDISDQATQLEELFLQTALAIRKPEPIHTGQCAWCTDPTPGAYCSNTCEADHTRWIENNK